MVIPLDTIGRGQRMRVPVVAGNWKMNTTLDEALELVEELVDALAAATTVQRLLGPPHIWLPLVYESVEETGIQLAAQNMHWADKGAYTGEIAPAMVAEFCDAVIIGHSERRQYFGETDEQVNRKVKAALAHELTPLLCIGEDLARREAGTTLDWVSGQLRAALDGLSADQVAETIIAYEPIWAIGTGRAATAEDAAAVLDELRQQLTTWYGAVPANAIRLLYGGSVTGRNIGELMGRPELDGVLVGGASLNAADFVLITETVAQTRP